MKTKICKICKETKDIIKFKKGKSYKDGHNTTCGHCRHLNDKPNNIENKFYVWKSNAIKKGLAWNLSLEYLKNMPQTCYYSGEELTFSTYKTNSISLDRIDSSKGYIVGNVAFCCSDINRMKQEFSVDYFIALCKKIVLHRS